MSTKLVTIGLLSYKRSDLLVDTLKCIDKTNIQIDLIIVNNNVDEDILQSIKEVITNDKINLIYIWDNINYGVALGRNKILENLNTNYVILLDDDVYIDNIDSIILNTITNFEEEAEVGALAFHIKDNKTKRENRYEIPHKIKNRNHNVDYYTYLFIGAGHALRKSALDVVGFYPNDFGLYGMEEIDLSFRMIKYNYKIKYIANNIIYHKKSPDGRQNNKTVHYLSFVNRFKIAKNYFRAPEITLTFIVRGSYFLYKTKDPFLYLKAINTILKYEGKNLKYDKINYQYIKDVEGFILW